MYSIIYSIILHMSFMTREIRTSQYGSIGSIAIRESSMKVFHFHPRLFECLRSFPFWSPLRHDQQPRHGQRQQYQQQGPERRRQRQQPTANEAQEQQLFTLQISPISTQRAFPWFPSPVLLRLVPLVGYSTTLAWRCSRLWVSFLFRQQPEAQNAMPYAETLRIEREQHF